MSSQSEGEGLLDAIRAAPEDDTPALRCPGLTPGLLTVAPSGLKSNQLFPPRLTGPRIEEQPDVAVEDGVHVRRLGPRPHVPGAPVRVKDDAAYRVFPLVAALPYAEEEQSASQLPQRQSVVRPCEMPVMRFGLQPGRKVRH